jgi:ParB-like chromosome segregation protein Spo0J
MKEKINKDMETLKNNQYKINNAISQINITSKSLANRVEKADNRVSGTEDRVDELDQIVKGHEKSTKKILMEHARNLGHHEKTKPMNHGYRIRRGDTN